MRTKSKHHKWSGFVLLLACCIAEKSKKRINYNEFAFLWLVRRSFVPSCRSREARPKTKKNHSLSKEGCGGERLLFWWHTPKRVVYKWTPNRSARSEVVGGRGQRQRPTKMKIDTECMYNILRRRRRITRGIHSAAAAAAALGTGS